MKPFLHTLAQGSPALQIPLLCFPEHRMYGCRLIPEVGLGVIERRATPLKCPPDTTCSANAGVDPSRCLHVSGRVRFIRCPQWVVLPTSTLRRESAAVTCGVPVLRGLSRQQAEASSSPPGSPKRFALTGPLEVFTESKD